ncbi:Hypothetical_protein [Hexamita inflata]|uniref:Hypothetical_protein n=1 Tax=Hexamita inflata TaxID=28002 RepID=A0ABP1HPK6_9EUKA
MLTLFFTLCVQVQNSTLSEKQTASYLDIGTIYGLEIKVGLPQQYQIAASKSQLEINATDFADVFMCISSTLMEPETAVCELQITAKGKYDLSPGLKFVLLYSKVANKLVIFSVNIKVSQLVHQEQTKITLLKDIITFANAQVNLQSLNDYKQIVVQSTISGLPPAEECKITYFVNNMVQTELTNQPSQLRQCVLHSFLDFLFPSFYICDDINGRADNCCLNGDEAVQSVFSGFFTRDACVHRAQHDSEPLHDVFHYIFYFLHMWKSNDRPTRNQVQPKCRNPNCSSQYSHDEQYEEDSSQDRPSLARSTKPMVIF